jgi:hypothetical protein
VWRRRRSPRRRRQELVEARRRPDPREGLLGGLAPGAVGVHRGTSSSPSTAFAALPVRLAHAAVGAVPTIPRPRGRAGRAGGDQASAEGARQVRATPGRCRSSRAPTRRPGRARAAGSPPPGLGEAEAAREHRDEVVGHRGQRLDGVHDGELAGGPLREGRRRARHGGEHLRAPGAGGRSDVAPSRAARAGCRPARGALPTASREAPADDGVPQRGGTTVPEVVDPSVEQHGVDALGREVGEVAGGAGPAPPPPSAPAAGRRAAPGVDRSPPGRAPLDPTDALDLRSAAGAGIPRGGAGLPRGDLAAAGARGARAPGAGLPSRSSHHWRPCATPRSPPRRRPPSSPSDRSWAGTYPDHRLAHPRARSALSRPGRPRSSRAGS